VRWSGRPIIYQAARAHEFTIIISPHRALRPRNPPARVVRSAVLLFGDVCGMIVGVDRDIIGEESVSVSIDPNLTTAKP
jgi:hypothetical protein